MESDIQRIHTRLRKTFDAGKTRPLSWRIDQLRALKRMITEREKDIFEAVKKDIGRCEFEAWIGEIALAQMDINRALNNLHRWIKPHRVSTPFSCMPGRSFVQWEPLGLILNISPWNYPFLLTIIPVIGAIAAGNCVISKPSEVSPNSSRLIAQCVQDYLDEEAVAVVEGGVEEATELLNLKFDHIFFTGGTRIGQIVMEKAAKHLTPVTLELGGKCPCIVDKTASLKVAARRIASGKFMNAGQTCIAPDYILVDKECEEELILELKSTVAEFYGDDIKSNPDYARIINTIHFQNLVEMLNSGKIVIGGETDEDEYYISPTILRNVDPKSLVMSEEIFGPILPVLTFGDLDEAINFVNAKPKPLAVYLFSRDRQSREKVLQKTSSGTACINDTMLQLFVPDLPFGGVGESGIGTDTGKYSFENLSHRKSILQRSPGFDVPLRYPPYSDRKLKWMKRIIKLG
jgi:aldehyde dehydrogenase (NAD+)